MSSISTTCQSYFKGCQDLNKFQESDSKKKVTSLVKVASYFTIIIPLIFGVIYAISSLFRKVTDIVTSTNLPIEKQLENFFANKEQEKKVFTIDNVKVGLIVNPKKESIKAGFITVKDAVLMVCDQEIPDTVLEKIKDKMPEGYTFSQVCSLKINGQTPLKALGF